MSDIPSDFWPRYEEIVALILSPLGPGDGVAEEQVEACEVRLGLALPLLLRELYLRTGRRDEFHRCHNRLLRLEEIELSEGVLIFYEENQAVVLWGILKADLDLDDPPVMSANNGRQLVWETDQERLSAFLVDMLLWQAVNGPLYSGIGRASAEAITQAGDAWQQIELGPSAGAKALVRDGQVLYVISQDLLDAVPDVHGGGRTVEDLRIVTETFDVAWAYSALDDEEEQEETDDNE